MKQSQWRNILEFASSLPLDGIYPERDSSVALLSPDDRKQRVQGFGAKVPRNDTKSRNIVNYVVKDVSPETTTRGSHYP